MTSAQAETSATEPTCEAGELGLLGAGGAGAEAYADVDAGVLEVEGVGVALGAVADDGYFFGLDEGEVCVCVVVGLCHGQVPFVWLVLRCQLLV